jgi:hypothetical protein
MELQMKRREFDWACVVTVEWMDGAYEDENYSYYYLLTLIFQLFFIFKNCSNAIMPVTIKWFIFFLLKCIF